MELEFRAPGDDRAPLVLLHGLTGSPQELVPCAFHLHEKLKLPVLLLQLESHQTFTALRYATAATWLQGVQSRCLQLASKHRGGLTLVGLSLGGLLALAVAQRCPSIISKVVAVAPPIAVSPPWAQLLLQWLSLFPVSIRQVLLPTKRKHSPATKFPRACYTSHWIATLCELVKVQQEISYAEVTRPALLLIDPDDNQVDIAAVRQAHRQLVRGSLVEMPGATHEMLLGARYQDVWSRIEEFVCQES